jgi:hypothetical protein
MPLHIQKTNTPLFFKLLRSKICVQCTQLVSDRSIGHNLQTLA